jgi:general secretion pathway protein D
MRILAGFAFGVTMAVGCVTQGLVMQGQVMQGQAVPSPVSGTANGQRAGGAQSPAAVSPATAKPADGVKAPDQTPGVTTGAPLQAGTIRMQRRAAKLYVEGVELMKREQPEAAWRLLKQAAEFDPGNGTYAQTAELARQSAVTQLVERASRLRSAGGEKIAEAQKLLEHALEIDPGNPLVKQHWDEMSNAALSSSADQKTGASNDTTHAAASDALQEIADDSTARTGESIAGRLAAKDTAMADLIELQPSVATHSFHLHSNAKQVIQEVFRAYGIEASVHESVTFKQMRFDLDDANFAQAARVLGMATESFYEPLDSHRVVVAKDTKEFRGQFQRLAFETVYLPGLTDKELTDVVEIARNAFGVTTVTAEPTQRTLTLRAPPRALTAFNQTIGALEDGRNQVDLDVKVIELSHISDRETGTTGFQSTSVYNLATEANSILSQNQAAVQEIIAQGLVPDANTIQHQIEIILILLAAGQLTGAPFNQGLAVFGGGITTSLLAMSPATLTMSLNSSDTRMLDDIHLRLQDDEAGTYKVGQRYPITTSSFSSVALPAIAGLSAVAAAASQVVPQIEYQDLGLTLKATPKVMRGGDVAINMDLKIQALGGTALNDIPILDSRAVTGVLTLRAGETALMISDLSRSESRALSGLPGISDLPGLQNISDIARNQNVARLLILVTPRVIRSSQDLAHGPRFIVDPVTAGR